MSAEASFCQGFFRALFLLFLLCLHIIIYVGTYSP